MSAQQSQLDILGKYLNLLIRGHKLIIVCLLLAVTAAIPYYISIPDIYQSSASIIYQEQNINPTRSAPRQEMRFEEMVNTVTQQVLSRKNLEDIIKQFSLYPSMQKEFPLENIMERLRENDVEVNVDRGRGNVFSVSFKYNDPQKAQQVTNALASKFIEENLRMREEQARERASYIQDELRMSKEKLHEKEAQMRDYKLKHYNEMPQQRESNMNRLNALQEQLQAIQSNIHNLEQTRLLISEQLELRRNMMAEGTGSGASGADSEGQGAAAQLAEARSRRQELLARYTREHPSVKRIEKRISSLESEIEGQFGAQGESDESPEVEAGDSRIRELTLQLKEIDLDLENLRKESKNIREQIGTYQEWIDAAPVREAEWAALTRDYDELRSYHDELLSQSLAAEAAEGLEKRQQGSRFKIVDSAFLPNTPVKGPFPKILLVSIALGLAVGGGILMGTDFLNPAFKDRQEVEAFLQIPVAAVLPLIVTESEKRRNRIKNIVWYCSFAIWLFALIGAAVYFQSQGALII
ncbi:MAG: Wzz/FepE/Etk N-terminal domain-containing protein [Desulfobacterales bacterium]|nr:Wzz/FepE/Etk N-terminal domain-containing protein [Desulfobacterales bacterium]